MKDEMIEALEELLSKVGSASAKGFAKKPPMDATILMAKPEDDADMEDESDPKDIKEDDDEDSALMDFLSKLKG
jgi:hypothetical protein